MDSETITMYFICSGLQFILLWHLPHFNLVCKVKKNTNHLWYKIPEFFLHMLCSIFIVLQHEINVCSHDCVAASVSEYRKERWIYWLFKEIVGFCVKKNLNTCTSKFKHAWTQNNPCSFFRASGRSFLEVSLCQKMPLTNELWELKVCILTYIGRVCAFIKFHLTLKRSGWKLHYSLCWYDTEWTNTGHKHMKFIQHCW